jgi:hypothetical protein
MLPAVSFRHLSLLFSLSLLLGLGTLAAVASSNHSGPWGKTTPAVALQHIEFVQRNGVLRLYLHTSAPVEHTVLSRTPTKLLLQLQGVQPTATFSTTYQQAPYLQQVQVTPQQGNGQGAGTLVLAIEGTHLSEPLVGFRPLDSQAPEALGTVAIATPPAKGKTKGKAKTKATTKEKTKQKKAAATKKGETKKETTKQKAKTKQPTAAAYNLEALFEEVKPLPQPAMAPAATALPSALNPKTTSTSGTTPLLLPASSTPTPPPPSLLEEATTGSSSNGLLATLWAALALCVGLGIKLYQSRKQFEAALHYQEAEATTAWPPVGRSGQISSQVGVSTPLRPSAQAQQQRSEEALIPAAVRRAMAQRQRQQQVEEPPLSGLKPLAKTPQPAPAAMPTPPAAVSKAMQRQAAFKQYQHTVAKTDNTGNPAPTQPAFPKPMAKTGLKRGGDVGPLFGGNAATGQDFLSNVSQYLPPQAQANIAKALNKG